MNVLGGREGQCVDVRREHLHMGGSSDTTSLGGDFLQIKVLDEAEEKANISDLSPSRARTKTYMAPAAAPRIPAGIASTKT